MLLSLRASLQSDLMSYLHQCNADILELGGGVGHIEDKMCDLTSSFNVLVDSHASHQDELSILKAKIVDRSHCNKLKSTGILASIHIQFL